MPRLTLWMIPSATQVNSNDDPPMLIMGLPGHGQQADHNGHVDDGLEGDHHRKAYCQEGWKCP